jgi:GAF domain-containing protein
VKPEVRDLAGAVSDGVAVDWKSLREARGGQDSVLDNLEVLDRIAEGSGSRRLHQGESQRSHLSRALAPWETLLLLVAAARAIVAVTATIWSLPSESRELLFAQLSVAASCLVGGLVLLRGAPADRRAIALAGILLTSAAATSWPSYRRLFAPQGGGSFDPLAVLLPEALFAYWIWDFVSVFPRRVLKGPGDGVFALGRTMSLAWGSLLLIAHALSTLIPSWAPNLRVLARTGGNFWFWGVIGILTLAALPAMILATRRADREERRRSAFFLGAIGVGFLPLFAITVTESLLDLPGLTPFQQALELAPCLTVPFTTAYGILVRKVLPFRSVLQEATRYLLARITLGVVLWFPLIVIAFALFIQRDRSISEALGGGIAGFVIASVCVLAPLAWLRRPLLSRLDRAFNRESQDWHGHLAEFARGLGGTTTMAGVVEILSATVARPLGVESLNVFRVTDDGRAVVPSVAGPGPLQVDAGPALLAFDSHEPLIVDAAVEGSAFWWFPEADRQWILDARAGALVPMTIKDSPVGLLVIGPRRGDRAYEPEELGFLRAVAATLAAASARIGLEPIETAVPTRECLDCGSIVGSGSECQCGGGSVDARLPALLSGRYELQRFVGAGAMGRVYLARDVDLDRRVALKTLPEVSAESSIRIRQEARAMAGVAHPNLAVLYDVERWNGAPVLVSEYMDGGTLAGRLSAPMAIEEVVGLGRAMASALGALHVASFVHRDVKPSNIGYSVRGEPKLLDLGLAEIAPRSRRISPDQGASVLTLPSFAGTPRYAPPEGWRGDPVGPEGDLWALAMTMYESIVGRHPLVGVDFEDWPKTLRSLPGPMALRQDCPKWLADLVSCGLALNPLQRWRTAEGIWESCVKSEAHVRN